jgi:5-bromo-4-chloroindolyl phosphate hydrolysis protein
VLSKFDKDERFTNSLMDKLTALETHFQKMVDLSSLQISNSQKLSETYGLFSDLNASFNEEAK